MTRPSSVRMKQQLDTEEQTLATQRRRVRKHMEAAAALKKARLEAKEMATRVGIAGKS